MNPRFVVAAVLLAIVAATVGWGISSGRLEPADFTFNNGTEIRSLDPAVLTDNASGRISWAIYEGLVRLSPDDRSPLPGMAERWDVSDDGLTYTFHLRRDARWTNGDPVTADDFVYSMRRFLDPQTKVEYVYQAWYLKNAKRYTQTARGVSPGDAVEVELHDPPAGGPRYARGQLVRGRLLRVEEDATATAEQLADNDDFTRHRTFVVAIDDAAGDGVDDGAGDGAAGANEQRFRVTLDKGDAPPEGARACKQLLLDFREVGIRAVDRWTVEMVLEAPTPYWLELIGFYPLAPVNQRCLEEHGPRDWHKVENVVTNGAYRVAFRRIRDRIRLEKNPDYWNAGNVALETIDALSVELRTTAFNLYETGKCDWVDKTPALIAKELLKADPPRGDLNPAPYLGAYIYVFNTKRKPLDDPRVRRALALAIDRGEIIDTAGAGERPARSFCPPGLGSYRSPLCPAEDPQIAAELLAKAGYPDGAGFPKIEILYNTDDQHETIAELARKQWRRNLKINVSTRNQEWTTSLVSQRTGDFDIARYAWIGDYGDPNTFLDLFVSGGENNNTGWGNPEYDRLIRGAAMEVDPAERLAMLYRAEAILMDELPIIPIYHYVSRNLVRPHIRGFYNNTQDTHPLWALWIDRDSGGPNEYMATRPVAPAEETAAGDATASDSTADSTRGAL